MNNTERNYDAARQMLESIREDCKHFDRERILDAWQMNILMRNDDHDDRLSKLEIRVGALTYVMYVVTAISGTALGFALCRLFT